MWRLNCVIPLNTPKMTHIFLWSFVCIVWFLLTSCLTGGACPCLSLFHLAAFYKWVSLQHCPQQCDTALHKVPHFLPHTFCQNAVNIPLHFHGMIWREQECESAWLTIIRERQKLGGTGNVSAIKSKENLSSTLHTYSVKPQRLQIGLVIHACINSW